MSNRTLLKQDLLTKASAAQVLGLFTAPTRISGGFRKSTLIGSRPCPSGTSPGVASACESLTGIPEGGGVGGVGCLKTPGLRPTGGTGGLEGLGIGPSPNDA